MRWYTSILRDHSPAAWQIIGTGWSGKKPVEPQERQVTSGRVKFDSLAEKEG